MKKQSMKRGMVFLLSVALVFGQTGMLSFAETAGDYEMGRNEETGGVAVGADRGVQEKEEASVGAEQSDQKKDGASEGAVESGQEKEETLEGADQNADEKDGALEGADESVGEKDEALEGADESVHEKDGVLEGTDESVREKDEALEEADESSQEDAPALEAKAPPEEEEKNILRWDWVDGSPLLFYNKTSGGWEMNVLSRETTEDGEEKQTDKDGVIARLPGSILATVEGNQDAEEIELDGWESQTFRQNEEGEWPEQGEYAFTTEVPEGYKLPEGGNELEITIRLYRISQRTINDRFTSGGFYYKETGAGTVQLTAPPTGKYEPTGKLVLEGEVTHNNKRYRVTTIGPKAFMYCYELTEVSVPDGITAIEEDAFYGCNKLERVSLPDSLTIIKDTAFNNCSKLDEVSLPDSLVIIGNAAFSGCSKLSCVEIPASVEEMGERAFSNTDLKRVTFKKPSSLSRIRESSFEGCKNLENVELPDGVERIEDSAFAGSGLKDVTLENLLLLSSIGGYAFNECGSLESIKLPGSVKSIGENAFERCRKLSRVEIPGSVESIGTLAFSKSGLSELTFENPSSLASIGNEAFSSCKMASVKIPSSVTTIGEGAFSYCPNLAEKSVTAGSPAVDILLQASGLDPKFITVEGGTPAQNLSFDENGWSYFVTDTTRHLVTLVSSNAANISGNVVIPESVDQSIGGATQSYTVTQIGDDVFSACEDMTGVTIPDSVVTIGAGAFESCTKLDNVVIPDTVLTIGASAFENCSSLGSVTIPGSVNTIGNCAFQSSGLREVTFGPQSSVASIGDKAFSRCDNLKTVTFDSRSQLASIGYGAFSYCKELSSVTLPEQLESIEPVAFVNCKALTGVKFPSTLKNIDNFAFNYSGLTSVELPERLESIGGQAFQNTGLTSVTLPESVTAVGTLAFWGCKSLKSVTIRGRLNSLGLQAFPKDVPIHCWDPETQILVTERLDQDVMATSGWDGRSDIPGGAVVEVDKDIHITGDVTIGGGAEVTIPAGVTVTVENGAKVTLENGAQLTLDGVLVNNGTIENKGNITGSGTLDSRGGRITGTGACSITVLWPSAAGGSGFSGGKDMAGDRYALGAEGSVSVGRGDIQKPAAAGRSLTIEGNGIVLTFDSGALQAILAATAASADGNVIFSAIPADISQFPEAQKLIGARPAFELAVGCLGSDGQVAAAPTDFGAGKATVSIAYPYTAGEAAGGLAGVYVDENGIPSLLNQSIYDSSRGLLIVTIKHLSVYGIGYRTPAGYTDIAGHWAEEGIQYSSTRGLLAGTGGTRFSPDEAITHGELAGALCRLWGIDPSAGLGVMDQAGDPEAGFTDTPVTREKLAVLINSFVKQQGYQLPSPVKAVVYLDEGQISVEAKEAVAALQQAGILRGKQGGYFDPQGQVTRGEAAEVLRRFAGVLIDSGTVQGFQRNDSGEWMYYRNGVAVTGWQQIGEKWYYFLPEGSMAVNTRIDGYDIGPDGTWKEKETEEKNGAVTVSDTL